jgi:hypothetical protein
MLPRVDAARGQSLPAPLQARLARYFPGLDLGEIRLHEGVPRYVRGRPRGYVNRHRVYLASGWQDDADVEVLALLAHDRQYRDMGAWRFRWAYLREYLAGRLRRLGHDAAYRNISFERAAREVEERVRRDFARRAVQA